MKLAAESGFERRLPGRKAGRRHARPGASLGTSCRRANAAIGFLWAYERTLRRRVASRPFRRMRPTVMPGVPAKATPGIIEEAASDVDRVAASNRKQGQRRPPSCASMKTGLRCSPIASSTRPAPLQACRRRRTREGCRRACRRSSRRRVQASRNAFQAKSSARTVAWVSVPGGGSRRSSAALMSCSPGSPEGRMPLPRRRCGRGATAR